MRNFFILLGASMAAMLVLYLYVFGVNYKFPKTEKAEKAPKKELNGLVRKYDDAGNLHTTITYSHGVKNGDAHIYYKNGKVMLHQVYVDGKRQGESEKYYEDGKLYAITPYKDDMLTGIRQVYHRNGKVRAEVPYFENNPGIGLKSYLKDGTLQDLPALEVRQQTQGATNLYLFNVDIGKKQRFYIGELVEGQFLSTDPHHVTALPMYDESTAYYSVDIREPSRTVHIIGSSTLTDGIPYITVANVEINH